MSGQQSEFWGFLIAQPKFGKRKVKPAENQILAGINRPESRVMVKTGKVARILCARRATQAPNSRHPFVMAGKSARVHSAEVTTPSFPSRRRQGPSARRASAKR